MDTKKHENLLYKELSYQIQGAAFEVRKNFGSGLKESIYQNALAEEFRSRNLRFEKEKSIQIFSPKTGKFLGSYRPDFIVDGKILVELKAVEKIPKLFLDQLYSYLRNSEYELGYFINFASPKLYVKRVIFTNDRKPFIKNTQKDTNMIRIVTKFSCLLVCLFVFFSVSSARAAELFFDNNNKVLGIDQTFKVDFLLNTEKETVNAVDGTLLFPADLVEVKEIRDGNSIINLWVERPKLVAGKIVFSGITPGGYRGDRGQLFSVIFHTLKTGDGLFDFSQIHVLLNDGQGTEVKTTITPMKISVSTKSTSPPTSYDIVDADPPEAFTLSLGREKSIENNKWFVVFATQDKGVGIDHYEIQEAFRSQPDDGKWLSATSPFILKDQGLGSYIFVKAIDKKGNQRVAILAPTSFFGRYKKYLIWSILLVGFSLIIGGLWKKRRGKHL